MSSQSIARVPHVHAEVIKAWADGAQIEYRVHCDDKWQCINKPQFDMEFQYRVKPGKVYPVTQMKDGAICSAYYGGGPVNGNTEELAAFSRIANAALRHAIDAGQVVAPGEAVPGVRPYNPYTGRRRDQHDIDSDPMGMLIHHQDESLASGVISKEAGVVSSRADRDMAIAEAVEKAFFAMVAKYSTGCAHFASQGVILPLIIAGVRP